MYHIVYYTIFFISFQANKSNKLNNPNKSNSRQYRDIAVKIFLKLAYRHSGIKKGLPENR